MTESAILHTDFISQKGSTSVSSSEVNMAEATPITEESTINRLKFFSSDRSHLQATDFHLQTNDSLTLVKQLSRDCTVL